MFMDHLHRVSRVDPVIRNTHAHEAQSVAGGEAAFGGGVALASQRSSWFAKS
jgi:hypothetical protein